MLARKAAGVVGTATKAEGQGCLIPAVIMNSTVEYRGEGGPEANIKMLQFV